MLSRSPDHSHHKQRANNGGDQGAGAGLGGRILQRVTRGRVNGRVRLDKRTREACGCACQTSGGLSSAGSFDGNLSVTKVWLVVWRVGMCFERRVESKMCDKEGTWTGRGVMARMETHTHQPLREANLNPGSDECNDSLNCAAASRQDGTGGGSQVNNRPRKEASGTGRETRTPKLRGGKKRRRQLGTSRGRRGCPSCHGTGLAGQFGGEPGKSR